MSINRFLHLMVALACLVLPQVARAQGLSLVAGDWKGDWSGSGEQGWIGVTIQSNGALTGFVISRSRGTSDECTGQLQANGTITLVVGSESRRREVSGVGKLTARSISGQASFLESGRRVAVKFSLKRAAVGDFLTGPKFAGVWSGTWSTGITKGIMRVVVDSEGSFTAVLVNSTYGNTAEWSGTIINTGVLFGEGETEVNGAADVLSYEFVGDLKGGRDSLSGKIYAAQPSGPAAAATVSLKREVFQPFEGYWVGTAKVNGVTLQVEIEVDVDGAGFFVFSDLSGEPIASIEVLVLANGSFAGVDEDGAIHSGSLRKSGYKLSGSGLEVAGVSRIKYTLQLVRAG